MKKLKIAFASSEAVPFVKTGGLADVTHALTRNLAAEGHDVRLFIPRYYAVDRTRFDCRVVDGPLGVPIGNGERWAALYISDVIPGVKTYLIEHDAFFGRDGVYDDGYNAYADNAERFTFYCRAVMQACLAINFSPDIIHCNDWQTGLIPIYAKTLYKNSKHFAKTKSVMTIHNLGYQGVFSCNDIDLTQLGREALNEDCLKFNESINFLKGGILWADGITTVSRRYAEEIKTPGFGNGLSDILKKRSEQLSGITNGVDYEHWDPMHDHTIPVQYGISKMRGKLICKEYLQNEMKLKVNPEIPLLATISRITYQKGIDQLLASIESLRVRHDFQFVLLGSGDAAILDRYESLCKEFPSRFALYRGYDDRLAHRIEAGADIYCMPSRYEPCGLNQMYSQRYGTIPVVRATGGLDDTVEEWNPLTKEGTGFKFGELSVGNLNNAIESAIALFHKKEDWEIIRRNAMKFRKEWIDAVREYERVYETLIHGPGHLM
jgi:starch synthase